MKIYQLGCAKAGVIEKRANENLYNSLISMIKGEQDSSHFADALFKSGLAPRGMTALQPMILASEESITIIVPQEEHTSHSELNKLRKDITKLLSKNKEPGEGPISEVSDEDFLTYLSDESESEYNTFKTREENICVESSESHDCRIYKLNRPGDVFKFKNVAMAFYYYDHEYYILTESLLDDFLEQTFKDVTAGREILPDML